MSRGITTVQEFTQEMEKMLPLGESREAAHAVTGEGYISHAISERSLSPESYVRILDTLWTAFEEQVVDGAVLYWRVKPEYIQCFEDGEWWSKVYMRYLVSGSPPK